MKRYFLLLMICAFWVQAQAQNTIAVKGIVTDANNLAMPGATVTEKGTANSSATDDKGAYQIKVKAGAVLVFTHLGSKVQEQPLNGRTTINVKLLDDVNSLTEVVVLGYGQTQTKKDLTGAVSSLKGEEISKVPVPNVAQALQGRLAGVQVTLPSGDPGATPQIKIRGGSSITQSNEPLYVVDGVPQTDGLAFLDPSDIQSVDILKDASSTAIYGARGANGVVLITTKQTKGGKTTINYDGYVGVQTAPKFLPTLTPYEYILYTYENSTRDAVRSQKFLSRFGDFSSLEQNYGNRSGVNWQDEIFGRTAGSQYHKISVNGGSGDTKYNLFYSRNVNDGLMLRSGANRDIAKLTVSTSPNKKLKLTSIVNYSNQKIYGSGGTQEGGNARLNMLQTLLQYRPVNTPDMTDEDLKTTVVDPLDDAGTPAFQSPLITVNTRLREQRIRSLNANATARYAITDKFTYNGLVSFNNIARLDKSFNEANSITAIRNKGAFGEIENIHNNRFTYNNSLTYSDRYGKSHKFDITLGQEYIYNFAERAGASATNFPNVNNGWFDLGLGTVAGFPSSFAEEDKLLSFFSRANYSYKGKYLLSATLRADGSSKFGVENKWGYFPSGSAAWRIVEEDFMKPLRFVSDLKLRASYGTSGNNRIANYAALGVFASGQYSSNTSVLPTVFQNSLANPFLKWEAVKAANIGVDMGFFKQRIALSVDLFDNRSQDLLYNTIIPASSGFTRQFQNIGATRSRGIEFALNTINVRNADFSWNTNFNIAFTRTKVLKLSDGEKSLITDSYDDRFQDYILQVGQPVGTMYGYVQDGLYQVADFDYDTGAGTYSLKPGVIEDQITVQPGFIKFKDLNGDGKITPDGDRTIVGNANPKFSGGINNTFSYKGFDLSVFLNFTVGNDIYNANMKNNLTIAGDFGSNLAFQANRWTNINAAGQLVTDPAELAAINQGRNSVASILGNTSGRMYNSLIENGSFLRINNVSLGYTLPSNWLKSLKIANARFYVTAYNLHVFTNYSGYDPEVSVINNPLTPGVDFSAYPRPRSFVAGINLSL